jgi:hypothetical protein
MVSLRQDFAAQKASLLVVQQNFRGRIAEAEAMLILGRGLGLAAAVVVVATFPASYWWKSCTGLGRTNCRN